MLPSPGLPAKMEGLKNLDKLKERFSQEPEEQKKKRKCGLVFNTSINLILGIAMVSVGAVYDPDCTDGNATYFLQVGGSYLIISQVIKLAIYLIPMEMMDKLANSLAPALDFGYFIIIIWGSVIVFGKW